MMEPNLIMSRAVTQLAFNQPFFGSIALSTGMSRDETIDTMCTDGSSIYYAPNFVSEISFAEVEGTIAHEVMHIVLCHHLRRGNRDPFLWNCSCDYVANLICKDAGLELPEGILIDEQYRGMTAEQVYDRLPKNFQVPDDTVMLGEVKDAKNKNGEAPSEAEIKQMTADVQAKAMMAAESARMRGKMPASLSAVIDEMKKADIDLHSVMSRFMSGQNPDYYSTARPNRKKIKSLKIVAPTVIKTGCGNVVFSMDTSGSVLDNEIKYFLGVANELVDEMRPTSVTVITWDSKVRTVKRYEEGEEIQSFEIGGRGGTSVSPMFSYVEDMDVECDQMICLSDMGIHDYPDDPDYPVLWVSSWSSGRPAPFGETAYLNCP